MINSCPQDSSTTLFTRHSARTQPAFSSQLVK